MDALAAYALAAVHGGFGYTHVADPVGTINNILGPAAGKNAGAAMTKHAMCVLGAAHVFIALLFVMVAVSATPGLRKCTLGIYLTSFIPIGLYAQWAFPPTGKPPADLTAMPLPLLYAFGGIALVGVLFGASSAEPSKKKTK